MKVLLGHITSSSLLRREALSLLRAPYAFSAKAGSQPLALWRSVREELWLVRSPLPLLQADLLAPWHGQVVASDASEFGLGLVRRRPPTDRVAELGRQSERWRHRVEGGARARERALRHLDSSSPPLPSSTSSASAAAVNPFAPLEFLNYPDTSFDEIPGGGVLGRGGRGAGPQGP